MQLLGQIRKREFTHTFVLAQIAELALEFLSPLSRFKQKRTKGRFFKKLQTRILKSGRSKWMIFLRLNRTSDQYCT
ncbi:MAG: hypothetical protein ACKOPH_06050, partial [Methylocystis sp.]